MSLRILGYLCLSVITGAILATGGLLAWFIADRRPPVELVRSELVTPVVKPGDKLVIRNTVRYLRDCKGHIDRALYDSRTHRAFLPDVDYERPLQGLGEFTYTTELDVPSYFESGPAHFRAVPSYYCNFVHTYYWPIERPEVIMRFEVASPQ